MRISDWSSDVCSSDLPWSLTLAACRALPVDAKIRLREDRFSPDRRRVAPLRAKIRRRLSAILGLRSTWAPARRQYAPRRRICSPSQVRSGRLPIGRASCRERVCQYVYISVVAASIQKKHTTKYTTQQPLTHT